MSLKVTTETPSDLNAQINLKTAEGKLQLDKDREAARQYFLQVVNPNTMYFSSLEEKLEYLVENEYYEQEYLQLYPFEFIKSLYQQAYAYKFRFDSYLGAYKFYTSYALKTFNGQTYLERYEDRVVAVALYMAEGDMSRAVDYVHEIITNRFQPATPTFLNAGKKQRGELVSCFEAGTPVLTPKGSVPIERVQVGDLVVSAQGNVQPVTQTFVSQSDKFVELKVSGNHNTLRATPEHPVLVHTDREVQNSHIGDGADWYSEWVAIKDVQPGDYVARAVDRTYNQVNTTGIFVHSKLVEHEGKVYVRTTDAKNNKAKGHNRSEQAQSVNVSWKLDEDFGRLIGYYLAEGYVHFTNGNCKGVRFTFNSNDLDYIEDCRQLLIDIWGVTPVVRVNSDGSTNVSVWSQILGEWLVTNIGTGFATKRLPPYMMQLNDKFARGLIVGVYRGDGCTVGNGMVLDLSNTPLVEQIAQLSIRIGALPFTRTYLSNSGNVTAQVKLSVGLSQNNYELVQYIGKDQHKLTSAFDPNYTQRYFKMIEGVPFYRVRSVEATELEEPVNVYNLEVTEDHTYVASGYAVHNCFLLQVSDNMESIGRAINSALQLSKRGGGVALCLTDLRETNAPIKNIEGQSSGVLPVMKLLEDSFSYANQLGARQGAGAVYLHAHHPDIMQFLDTKRENADEKIRIKTLSIGIVVPDITFELAKEGKPMYLFSPYDVAKVYGTTLSRLGVTKHYYEMVENPKIRKTKIDPRKFLQTIAELQFSSGYPYILFEDTVNKDNPIKGYINMSNLCVAPETMILTDKGQVEIATVAGQKVNVWNGERFSPAQVEQTGVDQKLLHVSLSDGSTLDATEYHKWYVQRGYGRSGRVEEVRTGQLQPGDKLVKFGLPITEHSDVDMPYAYTAGLFTADGTVGNSRPKIALYGVKKYLVPHMDIRSGSGVEDATGRLNYELPLDIAPKYTVPFEYSLRSKVEWLSGLIDGDGWGNNQAGVQIGSNRNEFLQELRLMLQTMGVHSKIVAGNKGTMVQFKEGQKAYQTKDVYRLVISGSETQKLVILGLKTHRLSFTLTKLQRSANHFVKVVSVTDEGRVSDTYCFNEPLRHMGVFNGILTGNCSEIVQINEDSEFNNDLSYRKTGLDISCNLGSMNIAKSMDHGQDIGNTVETAVRFLTAVSDKTDIDSVPTVERANNEMHSIGLGQMNLASYLAREHIMYGSPESVEFVSIYFALIAYHAIRTSCKLAQEKGETFRGFDDSKYADGTYFDKYLTNSYTPTTQRVAELFHGIILPSREDWAALAEDVRVYGMYNSYLQAVPPTGSISYINNSSASIHPITAQVEIRKEGKIGRVYYPAPYLNDDNREYFVDSYDVGYKGIIDVYAAAQEHVDQALSLTLFYKDGATTRDLNLAYIYAWRKGIKTLYYARFRQQALAGTEATNCVSCTL